MDTPIEYSKKLAKGRIAETIFEQMLRDAEAFTILEFGYEKVLPELAHRMKDTNAEETMKIIRRAPDFAVIDNTSHEVFLIEVKYMMHPNERYILGAAQKIYDYWKPAYLFLATPKGFYFDKASEIINNQGKVGFSSNLKIPLKLQEDYRDLLNELIPPTDQPEQEEI